MVVCLETRRSVEGGLPAKLQTPEGWGQVYPGGSYQPLPPGGQADRLERGELGPPGSSDLT